MIIFLNLGRSSRGGGQKLILLINIINTIINVHSYINVLVVTCGLEIGAQNNFITGIETR